MRPGLQRQRNLRAFFTHLLIATWKPYNAEQLTLLLNNYLALDDADPELTMRLLNSLPESTFPPTKLLVPSARIQEN